MKTSETETSAVNRAMAVAFPTSVLVFKLAMLSWPLPVLPANCVVGAFVGCVGAAVGACVGAVGAAVGACVGAVGAAPTYSV